jgi:hypothetical protein
MTYEMRPLPCDPTAIKGTSERLIVSHYENTSSGTLQRMNAITTQFGELDFAAAPIFVGDHGDFVLLGSELEPVLKALRESGIEVTAIYNHMTDVQPRPFFVHFWANDDAKKLAQGLRAALGHVNVAKS